MLVAFFLFVMIPVQEWPEELGPYTWEECFAVQEYLNRRGYDTTTCSVMPLPQPDAIYLEVPYLPREH